MNFKRLNYALKGPIWQKSLRFNELRKLVYLKVWKNWYPRYHRCGESIFEYLREFEAEIGTARKVV